jgi:hypothetical protein
MTTLPAGLQRALDGLYNAARSGDPTSAAPFATEAGWSSRTDSARRLVGQVFRGGLGLRFTGPAFVTPAQDRAAVRTEVLDTERVTDTIWILLQTVQGAWKVEGVGQDRTVVGLYLADQFSPVIDLFDLPPDDAAAAWAQAHCGERCDDDDAHVVGLREQGFTEASVASTHALPAIDRVAVVFEHKKPGDPHPRESMTVLQQTPDGLVPIMRGVSPARSRLLSGVEAVWEPQVAGASVRERMESLLGQAMGKLLELAGFDGAPLLADGGISRLMAALEAAGTAPMIGVDAAALDRAWGGDVSDRMQRRIQHAVATLLRAEGVEPSEVPPDSAEGRLVLGDKAASIVQVLLREVLRSVAPDDLSRDPVVPEAVPGVGAWIQAALASLTGHQVGEA